MSRIVQHPLTTAISHQGVADSRWSSTRSRNSTLSWVQAPCSPITGKVCPRMTTAISVGCSFIPMGDWGVHARSRDRQRWRRRNVGQCRRHVSSGREGSSGCRWSHDRRIGLDLGELDPERRIRIGQLWLDGRIPFRGLNLDHRSVNERA